MKEIRIKLKDEEGARKYSRDFVEYENFAADLSDPLLKKMLDQTIEEFECEPDSIEIVIKLKAK